jgi:hypothetical protein
VEAAKLDAAAVRAVVVAETKSGLSSTIGDMRGQLERRAHRHCSRATAASRPPTRGGVKIHDIAAAGEPSDLGMIKAYRKGKSAR